MKIRLALYGALLLASGAWASETGLELLPSGRLFRPTFVDPREVRMALTFEGDSKINAIIANYFSIFALRPTEGEAWKVHFGLEGGGYFTMRQAQSRYPLETADGLIGTYIEGVSGDWQGQLRYTHISAHLADGSFGIPIAYSRETLISRVAYFPGNGVHLYGGLQWIINSTPNVEPLALQMGGAYFLSLGATKLIPFVGTDLKWKQESVVNPSFALQLGFALNNPPEAYRSFRFFYSYFTGTDPRGQYFDRVFTSHSVGIEMQI